MICTCSATLGSQRIVKNLAKRKDEEVLDSTSGTLVYISHQCTYLLLYSCSCGFLKELLSIWEDYSSDGDNGIIGRTSCAASTAPWLSVSPHGRGAGAPLPVQEGRVWSLCDPCHCRDWPIQVRPVGPPRYVHSSFSSRIDKLWPAGWHVTLGYVKTRFGGCGDDALLHDSDIFTPLFIWK